MAEHKVITSRIKKSAMSKDQNKTMTEVWMNCYKNFSASFCYALLLLKYYSTLNWFSACEQDAKCL